MSAMTPAPAYALLADGSTVLVRPAGPADFEAVKAMHEAMSPDNLYLRFFSIGPLVAEREASRVCREAEAGRAALLALSGDEVVGCASYEPAPGGHAEIAFAVADRMHHKGIATLLLEHLVSRARDDGIEAFVAETLAENTAMLRVFADAGLPVRKRCDHGVMEVTIPIPRDDTDTALDVVPVGGRASGKARPDTASLRAPVRARVRRGDRRQPADGHGRAGGTRQHPHRRLRRPPVRGQPARLRPGRRALRARGGRVAGGARPRGDRCSPRGGDRRRRGLRRQGRQGHRRDHGRAGRRGRRRLAGDLPPPRDAPGRAELLRHRGARRRPGRHVRRHPPAARDGRAGHAVRRAGLRAGGPAVPARHRHLLVRLRRRQARRLEQRHAAVVGARRRHPARRLVHRVVRQPAQVRPHRTPGRAPDAGADRAARPPGGRAAGRRQAHRGRRRPAGQPPGTVRAGGDHRDPRARRADRGRRPARHPAGSRGPQRRDHLQRRRRRRRWRPTPVPARA